MRILHPALSKANLYTSSLRKRFEQNQHDCNFTILALLPTLGNRVLEEMDVEKISYTLQRRPHNGSALKVEEIRGGESGSDDAASSDSRLGITQGNSNEDESGSNWGQPGASPLSDSIVTLSSNGSGREEEVGWSHQERRDPANALTARTNSTQGKLVFNVQGGTLARAQDPLYVIIERRTQILTFIHSVYSNTHHTLLCHPAVYTNTHSAQLDWTL